MHLDFFILTLTFALSGVKGQPEATNRTDCSVPQEFEVAWWSAPPYMFLNEQDVMEGPLVTLLDEAVKKCCNINSTVIFPHRFDNFHQMEEKWVHGTFAAPAVRTQLQQAFHLDMDGMVMLPVVESPGSVYFKHNRIESTSTTMDILLTGWPLLLLVLISAGFAGVIMWLLDTYWNPEQFPRPFLRGTWEGFWWAFVTMTTVGYGDRSPTSFFGKCFAIVWILAGIIILSIFTAAVTTALSAGVNTDDDPLSGHKIAVLAGSEEVKLVLAEGGVPIVFHNASRLMEAVCNQEDLDGGFMEYFAFTFLHLLHGDGCLRRVRSVKNPAMYGINVQGVGGDHVTASVSDCFVHVITRRRHRAFDSLEKHILNLQSLTTLGGSDVSSQIFQGLNFLGLGISLAVLALIMLIGIIWERLYWIPRNKHKQPVSDQANSSDKVDGNSAPSCQQIMSTNNIKKKGADSPERFGTPNSGYSEDLEICNKTNNTHIYNNTSDIQTSSNNRKMDRRKNTRNNESEVNESERSRSRSSQGRSYDNKAGVLSLQDRANGRTGRKEKLDLT